MFSFKICNLKIDVSCEACVNFQHTSQNATPATELAPCHHFTQPWQCDPQKRAAPATQNDDDGLQSAAPATKNATHLLKTSQKHCLPHKKGLSTRYETRLNVTKCHACHAKRSNATFETSKCRTYHRHGHTALTRTVGDGCGRLRTVAQRRANTPSTRMQTPRVKREPLLRIQEKGKIQMLYGFEPVHLR